ncbi:hypothetical protein V1669_18505, partial [Aeromonas enteropelogenes]|uniref:hypothetical protein n=2 Tax=Aeromonas enteropelogenes TaxID=29489 RepID=UPI00313710A4
ARVGHCQAPNMKTPLTERGFLLPEIQCFLMSRLIRSISIHNMYLLDIKRTECDASTFLVIPALV